MEGEELTGSGVAKIQTVSAKTDFLPGGGGLIIRIVLGVTDDGASDVGELYPNLVVTAGVQFDLQFCDISVGKIFSGIVSLAGGDGGVTQPCGFGIPGLRRADM